MRYKATNVLAATCLCFFHPVPAAPFFRHFHRHPGKQLGIKIFHFLQYIDIIYFYVKKRLFCKKNPFLPLFKRKECLIYYPVAGPQQWLTAVMTR